MPPGFITMSYIPYTYLIGWTILDCYYYGVRTAKGSTPEDFWKTYFTSSKQVKKLRIQYGDPDVIMIRKTFTSKESAFAWETKVLRRMKVRSSRKWLNISENEGFIGLAQKIGRPKNSLTVKCTKTGNLINIHPKDPKFLSGEYIHPTKGTKSVFDTVTQHFCRIPVDNNSDQYISINKGYAVVKIKNSETFIRIKKEDFDPDLHEHHRGSGPKNLSEEQRLEMSSRMSGERNPMYGKPGSFLNKNHSKESIEKIKKTKIERGTLKGDRHPMFGKSAVKGRKWYYDDNEKTYYLFPSDPLTANLHLGRKPSSA